MYISETFSNPVVIIFINSIMKLPHYYDQFCSEQLMVLTSIEFCN